MTADQHIVLGFSFLVLKRYPFLINWPSKRVDLLRFGKTKANTIKFKETK